MSFDQPWQSCWFGSAFAQDTPQTSIPSAAGSPSRESVGTSSADEVEMARVSHECMDAMLHHNTAKLEQLMAPEYVLRNWAGGALEISRTAWLDNLLNRLKIDRFEQKAMSAHGYGDVGVVTSKYDWAGTFQANLSTQRATSPTSSCDAAAAGSSSRERAGPFPGARRSLAPGCSGKRVRHAARRHRCLLQQSQGQRIAITLAIPCLDRGDHAAHQP